MAEKPENSEPNDEAPELSGDIMDIPENERVEDVYSGDSIQVLEGLEAVRRRPSMYIGGTDLKSMPHLFVEGSDNTIDEAMAGHFTHIDVIFPKDGSASVRDNSPGIPVGINKQTRMPA